MLRRDVYRTRWNSTGCHRLLCLCMLWPSDPKNLISTSMNPSTSATKIGWNYLHWFLRYRNHKVSGITWCDFDLWLFTPKFNEQSYEPKYTCDQNWVKFPLLVFEIWCSQCFRVAQSHSWTSTPEYKVQYAIPPAPKVFDSGAIKDNIAYNCVISGICIALKGKAVHFVSPLKCSGIRW